MNKMMLRTTLVTLATCLFGCQFALAQIELTYKKQLTIVGATSPEILQGGRILAEDDSKISISSVAVLRVASTDGVRLIAQRGFREFAELIPLGSTTDAESKIVTSRYLLVGEGRYTIDAISRTNDAWDRSVTIDIGPPQPPPKPDDPKPPPPPPGPVTSFRVIFVKESGQTLNADQTAISAAKDVRQYLTSKTTPENGLAGWREYDPQQNTASEQSKLKSLWTAAKSSITKVPCLVIEVNGKVSILEYPKNVADAVKILKEYGGN